MIRLNIVLLLILVVFALALVTSQHRARRAFQALEAEQERTRELELEHNLLELELTTLATPGRVEKIAKEKLKMNVPAATARGVEAEVPQSAAATGETGGRRP